jgi:hypothetical protein
MNTRAQRRRGVTLLALGLVGLVTLVACGGSPTPPEPTGVVSVSGTVTLPAGSGHSLASLSVSTPLGVYAVGADGSFEADVFAGARTELGVETTAGDLLLLGVSQGKDVAVSLNSTAEALLYYLVGGMWLPPENQDTVRLLLEGVPEAAAIAAELTRQLAAGGNGMTQPDSGLVAALESAHASLLDDPALRRLAVRAVTSHRNEPSLAPAAVEGSNIIIEPGDSVQAGAMILHNPSGSGVVAQNEFRRPAKLLVYETGWEDADGMLTENEPPLPVEEVDVPATGQLEFFNALLDVVTANSPWSPVLSSKVNLAGHEGANRTHYQLVVVGPSATDATWPIMDDPRFDIFHGHWEDIELEKSLELFLDELLLPLVEVYGLGSLAKFDAAKLSSMRARVRLIHDEHLAGLGVLLRNRQSAHVNGLKFVIEELVTNRNLRLDMVDMVREALAESDKNKAAIDAMEKRLGARAGASAIAAAVQTLLVSGDVAKIMYDLAGAPAVVNWTAVSAPSLFALTPDEATVTRANASARFTVVPKGGTSGDFRYRWTTSGNHGDLSDLLQDGITIDTDSNEIWYFHDSPLDIEDTDVDTVAVEVFEVEHGATSIPPGANPVARMAARVKGDDRTLDSRIELNYGTTPLGMYSDGLRFGCAEMYLRFDAEPGAKSYMVHARDVGGQNDERNSNQDFRLNGADQSEFIDPNAQWIGSTIEEGYTADWSGVCNWQVKGVYASQPFTFNAWYDREEDQYVVHLFTNVDYSGIVPNPVNLAERVELWHQWLEGATFEVVVSR